jgi:hypothetical protein
MPRLSHPSWLDHSNIFDIYRCCESYEWSVLYFWAVRSETFAGSHSFLGNLFEFLEAGLCYLAIHIENVLRTLQLFYLYLRRVYWLSLVFAQELSAYGLQGICSLWIIKQDDEGMWVYFYCHPATDFILLFNY